MQEEKLRRQKAEEEKAKMLQEAQRIAQSNVWGGNASINGASQNKKSLEEIQREEAIRVQQQKAQQQASNPIRSGTTWGQNPNGIRGTGNNSETAPVKKSMVEIQMEEAAAAAKRQQQQQKQHQANQQQSSFTIKSNNLAQQDDGGASAWGAGKSAQPKKSLEEIQREEAIRVQQQRAQRSGIQRGGKSGSSSLTMAERLASKHGVSGPSNMSFKNSNSGSTGGAMTSQLKQLLGVQSPGRPTHQRVVQNTNPAPGLEQVQATPDSSIQPTSFSRIRIKCVKSKPIQLGRHFGVQVGEQVAQTHRIKPMMHWDQVSNLTRT